MLESRQVRGVYAAEGNRNRPLVDGWLIAQHCRSNFQWLAQNVGRPEDSPRAVYEGTTPDASQIPFVSLLPSLWPRRHSRRDFRVQRNSSVLGFFADRIDRTVSSGEGDSMSEGSAVMSMSLSILVRTKEEER
jgi:hypothetical protein